MTQSQIIRDNRNNGSVGDFLKDRIKNNSKISIVSAYFTIYAYHALKDKFDNIESMRFLFGEPTFVKGLNGDKNPRVFEIEDSKLEISTQSQLQQKKVAKDCADWIRSKVEVKSMVKSNFLHGKLYHIDEDGEHSSAISGSSNFTTKGLGLSKNSNMELNLIVDSDNQRKQLLDWFNDLWNNSEWVKDVKEDVLKYIEQLYSENAPDFIYYKTLYEIFHEYLDDQKNNSLIYAEQTGFFESNIWNALYDFQKDGVKGVINKIQKHSGCIIADSVGLGKTYEALAVIKYFQCLNYRTLIICPKKLSSNWTLYQAAKNNSLNPFLKDRFNYSVLYHTDLGRDNGNAKADSIDLSNFNWGAYDLVVIDESHNFKGNPLEKTTDKGEVKYNRPKWLMEKILKAGGKTKVLMLSATPVNNNLRDLRNQISYITEGNNSAFGESLGIDDLESLFKNAQRQFTDWADKRRNNNQTIRGLLERLDSGFFKLLDEVTIARSRKHIIKYYNLNQIGSFPKRLKPMAITSEIDIKNEFPSYDSISKTIDDYRLSVYKPSAYLKEEYSDEALTITNGTNFRQEDRENFLVGMIKVNYLKRLESSIYSFNLSLERILNTIKKILTLIEKFRASGIDEEVEDNLESSSVGEEESEELEALSEFQVGKKKKYSLSHIDLEKWEKDLRSDRDAIISLKNNAAMITCDRDKKLARLKELIKDKVENPINGNNKKVIIFTAFGDTAKYLYDNLKDWAKAELKINTAVVCGSESNTTLGKNDFEHILLNFSPISKNRSQQKHETDGQIDLLIATDCISEGQNLQDCDYLINYDIHWNPVRIIQRFGRIDRIGSRNQCIQLVNFWPTEDLDGYINLKNRVETRMALVDLTATAEDNVLQNPEIKDLIDEELKYRTKQLKKLKDEVIDIEDLDDGITLTDFSLDDFRIDLANYIEENKDKLEKAPLGMYAVVPCPSNHCFDSNKLTFFNQAEKDIIKPGVIFCLTQKNSNKDGQTINPLYPYFLVYIRKDGVVRYNFTNSKKILEILQLICRGEKEPFNELCDMFNDETQDGKDMKVYENQLIKAADEVVKMFKKREALRLTQSRDAVIVKKANNLQDFNLITWFVIK